MDASNKKGFEKPLSPRYPLERRSRFTTTKISFSTSEDLGSRLTFGMKKLTLARPLTKPAIKDYKE
jgi:hypothetical protein